MRRHTLTAREKTDYLHAELCLMKAPVKIGLPGCRSLFDELQANHQIQALATHGVGAFLPYHRNLMHAHEYFLQTECGYIGAQPYWEETLDAGNFSSSILLDPVTGFGGNGRANDGCITDGPFANYTNALGPGFLITDHCISRNVSDDTSLKSSQSSVSRCYTNSTYLNVWPCLEADPHAGGHGGIGGDMINPISSPGDPIFYLHHTWLDKIWWDWQAQDLPKRLFDISGRNKQDPNVGFPEGNGGGCIGNCTTDGNAPPIVAGDPGNTTTLTHVLSSLDLLPNVTIADVMDIAGGYLCYEYI